MGKCKTVNFCDSKNYLHDDVDDEKVLKLHFINFEHYEMTENETLPYKTTSLDLGIFVTVFYEDLDTKAIQQRKNSFVLIVHSPLELPSKSNQLFHMGGLDYDTFFVTPHLNTIDDTMIGMTPEE